MMIEAMPDWDESAADWEDLVDWIYEYCAVNSDPDVDLDGDDDTIGADWDEMASWDEGEDEGDEEDC
jgi:hypothetical protein